MLAEEDIECYKLSLMSSSIQSSEDKNVDGNVNSKSQAQKVSVRNEDSFGSWTKGHVCYTLAKESFSTFCPSPEMLLETEIKGPELRNLAEEISKQLKIRVVAGIFLSAFS